MDTGVSRTFTPPEPLASAMLVSNLYLAFKVWTLSCYVCNNSIAISALFHKHSRPVLMELHITQVVTYLRQILLNCGTHLKMQGLCTQGTSRLPS